MVEYKTNIALLVAHQLHKDPRVEWLAQGFAKKDYTVVEFGLNPDFVNTPCFFKQKQSNILKIELSSVCSIDLCDLPIWNKVPVQLQSLLQSLATENKKRNQLNNTPAQTAFYWLCYHVYHVTCSMIKMIGRFTDFNLIVAIDCDSLLAGAILSYVLNIPLVYDAHEYWAESFFTLDEAARNYFRQFEKVLVKNYVDIPVTVTPQLSTIFESLYQKPYVTLPNAEPLDSLRQGSSCQLAKLNNNANTCCFLIQGNYAPGRGFEKIIKLWEKVPKNCLLYLRGHPSIYSQQYIELAEQLGLLDKTIFFIAPISEEQLIAGASQADVGIIPYEPEVTINHQYCCPNKLSQYMAAGIPIISNRLDFVAQILQEAECGVSVNFDDESTFITTITALAENEQQRKIYGCNGQLFFKSKFHWESLSQYLYDKIGQLSKGKSLVTNHIEDYFMALDKYAFDCLDSQDNVSLASEVTSTMKNNQLHAKAIRLLYLLIFKYMLCWVSSSVKQKLVARLKRIISIVN